MTRNPAVTVAAAGASRRRTGRIFSAVAGSLVLLAIATDARAQEASAARPHFEFLVHSGKLVPTGAQGDAVRQGNLTAAQLSYVVRPSIALTTTLGWTRSRDIASPGDPRLDVFTYDVGAEVRAPRLVSGARVHFSPFAGIGAGGRSYNYRSLNVDATHNFAGYASTGGELGYRRVRLRLEVRDYVSGWKPLAGEGATDTRNDVAFMAGLRFTR